MGIAVLVDLAHEVLGEGGDRRRGLRPALLGQVFGCSQQGK
jgi:hypothetical protein